MGNPVPDEDNRHRKQQSSVIRPSFQLQQRCCRNEVANRATSHEPQHLRQATRSPRNHAHRHSTPPLQGVLLQTLEAQPAPLNPCSKRLTSTCSQFNTTTLCQKLKRIISTQKLKPDAIFFSRSQSQFFSSTLQTAFKTSHSSAERARAQWAEQAGHLPSPKDCQLTTVHLSLRSPKPS